MARNNERFPFPQANDLEKVLKIINIPHEDKLRNIDELGTYLDGITNRQVCYYISATKYLGVLDANKNFTEIGTKLRGMNTYAQKIELIRIILSDVVFGTVFVAEKVHGMTLSQEDIAEIIEKEYPDYSNAIYQRRAQTVLSWIGWINQQFE